MITVLLVTKFKSAILKKERTFCHMGQSPQSLQISFFPFNFVLRLEVSSRLHRLLMNKRLNLFVLVSSKLDDRPTKGNPTELKALFVLDWGTGGP